MSSRQQSDKIYSEKMREIREALGMTQAEVAASLGISTKAVQSYEQGWRKVPKRAMIQIFVLLALNKRGEKPRVPCWKLRRCPQKTRKGCVAYSIANGDMCWFVTGGSCLSAEGYADSKDDVLPCVDCPVVNRLMDE